MGLIVAVGHFEDGLGMEKSFYCWTDGNCNRDFKFMGMGGVAEFRVVSNIFGEYIDIVASTKKLPKSTTKMATTPNVTESTTKAVTETLTSTDSVTKISKSTSLVTETLSSLSQKVTEISKNPIISTPNRMFTTPKSTTTSTTDIVTVTEPETTTPNKAVTILKCFIIPLLPLLLITQ